MLDEEATHSSYSWKHDPLFWSYSILMFLPIIMVFAFYNYYRLDFLVYAGWIVLVFSIVIIFLAGGEFRKKGGTPKGESIVHTTVLVDSGVYAVVRHPQYMERTPRMNFFIGIRRLLRRKRKQSQVVDSNA
jgi:protein-S-isoprenylcysteine O-methyltransferase Ste14